MIKVWNFAGQSKQESDYLKINAYGVQELTSCFIDRPEGLGDWLIMFFYNPMEVEVAKKKKTVAGPFAIIWPPGGHQYYRSATSPYLHSWIHCEGPLMTTMAQQLGLPMFSPIHGITAEQFERHLVSIHFENLHFTVPEPRIIENYVRNLLFDLHRCAQNLSKNRAIAPSIREARQYIESNYAQPVTLAQLARRANFSASYFVTQFKQAYGASPIDFLIKCRLSEAVYQLRNSNARVKQAAASVGINDTYYFSKLIKKHYGVSPKKLRLLRGRTETP
jgi:AraC family transcriptional regulator, arabinose operon regulatory protein